MLNDQGGWSKPMMPEVATTANKERGLFIDHHHTAPPPTLINGRTNETGNRASLQGTKSSKGKQGN